MVSGIVYYVTPVRSIEVGVFRQLGTYNSSWLAHIVGHHAQIDCHHPVDPGTSYTINSIVQRGVADL